MNPFEKVMREERWVVTDELFAKDRPEPPVVAAFRMLQEADWTTFVDSVMDNPALRFFNPEIPDFSSAADWAELSQRYGMAPFIPELEIPEGIPTHVQDFCRDLRNSMRAAEEEWCGGCKAFYAPEDWVDPVLSRSVLLVVCHDGGNVAPRFNLDYGQTTLYDSVDPMLKARGLWRDHLNPCVSYIFDR